MLSCIWMCWECLEWVHRITRHKLHCFQIHTKCLLAQKMAFSPAASFLLIPWRMWRPLSPKFQQELIWRQSSPEIEGIFWGCTNALTEHSFWGLVAGSGGVMGLTQEILVLRTQVRSPTLALETSFCFHPFLFPQTESFVPPAPWGCSDSGCRRVQPSDFRVWTASADGYKACKWWKYALEVFLHPALPNSWADFGLLALVLKDFQMRVVPVKNKSPKEMNVMWWKSAKSPLLISS